MGSAALECAAVETGRIGRPADKREFLPRFRPTIAGTATGAVMTDHVKRRVVANYLNIDFTELAKSVRSFEKEEEGSIHDLLSDNESKMFLAMESLCEIVNCLPPSDDRDELMNRIEKVSASISIVAMLQYQMASKAVTQEIAHDAARTKGDRSSDVTRETAILKRGKDGSRLSCAQLVPHVQERRKSEGLTALKDKNAETTIRRHLRGFSY